MTTVDNSFFHQSYKNKKVLVLAPHPDDEINVAGNMIYNLSHMGAEVFIAYSTNGDFEWSPEIRFAEVRKAASILGVDWEHIILLGYGDTYNGTGKPHVFHAKAPMTSPAGRNQTYGIKEKNEFAFQFRGKHSPYTSQAFLQDIKDLLLYIRADIIFCVDYDSHADHRALSLTFEKAMGEILCQSGNTYHPDVYKRFAYATGFTAKEDFGALNLLETKRPVVGVNESYDYDMIDKSIYQWQDRVRFPIAPAMRNTDLKQNPLAQAVFQHKSQHNERNALRLINSDEVYWQRRTDSISYQAKIKVSSGDGSRLNDFLLYSTDDIDSKIPHWANYLWQPDEDDDKKEVVFTWDEPKDIEEIRLYGMIESENSFKVGISFNQQDEQIIQTIPAYGKPLVLTVNKMGILSCTVRILENDNEQYGLSECEFYTTLSQTVIKPFIKLLYKDNFIYNLYKDRKIDKKYLSKYAYNDRADILNHYKCNNNSLLSIKMESITGKKTYDIIVLEKLSFRYKITKIIQQIKNIVYIRKLHKHSRKEMRHCTNEK